jgi:hypothetical protein
MQTKPDQGNPRQNQCVETTPPQQTAPPQTQPSDPHDPKCPEPQQQQSQPNDPKCPDPSGEKPKEPDAPKPPASTPTEEPPCKGVDAPADPGGAPPKTPSDKDCTPKDPCEEYYKTHDCSESDDTCKCSDRPPDTNPLTDPKTAPPPTIRQQLTAIEVLVNNPPKGTPADATKKLSDDLKDLEKEYEGLSALFALFEKDRATIECTFTTQVRKWYDEIHKLCDSNVSCKETLTAIQKAYDQQKQLERKACCDYIRVHDKITGDQNCQVQAERREAEARADLDLLKGLNKTFADRLKDLEEILKQANLMAKDRRFKAVCAYKLEFDAVWARLFQAETWCFRRKDCCICCPKCELLPNTLPCWTVERYRKEVMKALQALIAAKYNRYLWNGYWMNQEAEYKRLKDECDKAHTNRRARFIAEAEEAPDCPTPTPAKPDEPGTPAKPGDCGCGKPKTGGMTNA